MEKVIQFLKENSVTVLATSFEDKPRASAMEYMMIGDSIMFATSPDSIKANNLKRNNRLSLSVHNIPKFVTIDGIIVEPTTAEIEEFNNNLFKAHPEFKEMVDGGFSKPFRYYKVNIETAYYNDYTDGMSDSEIFKA